MLEIQFVIGGKEYKGLLPLEAISEPVLLRLLPEAGLNGELLISDNGVWKLASKLHGFSDETQGVLRAIFSATKRGVLTATDTSTSLQLGQALQRFVNSQVTGTESKVHLRQGNSQVEVIAGTTGSVRVYNANHGIYLLQFDTHPQLSLMSGADDNQLIVHAQTAGITVFRLRQNGSVYCKGFTLDITSKGAGKVLECDENGIAYWANKHYQSLSINGNQLSISNGNTVTLPSGSGAQYPARTLFVSPSFTNDARHFNTFIQAHIASNSGDTIIVYAGDYSSEGTVSIKENVTVQCIGEVIFNTLTTAVYGRVFGGFYNELYLGSDNLIDIDIADRLFNSNDNCQIKAKSIGTLDISGGENVKISANNIDNLVAYGNSIASVNSNSIGTISIYGNAETNVKAVKSGAVAIGSSSVASNSKAFIEIDKIDGNVSILNTCKAIFKNCQMKVNEVRLDNECNAKFHNCVIRANNSHVVFIRNCNFVLFDDCMIINQNTNAESIYTDINPLNVYTRGDCYSNVVANSNVNFILGTLTINPQAINEFLI